MAANGSPDLMSGAAPLTDLQLSATDSTDSRRASVSSPWGIFLKGTKVIEPDSIVALDYKREWRLADFPLEQGAFETYDKVAMPFDVHLRITKGGDEPTRAQFLADLEAISATLDQYDVVSPEFTYLSVNVTSLGVSRAAGNGMGLITAVLSLRQVRVNATQAFLEVQAPGSSDSVNDGTVQPQTPTPAVAAKAAKSLAKAAIPASAVGAPSH